MESGRVNIWCKDRKGRWYKFNAVPLDASTEAYRAVLAEAVKATNLGRLCICNEATTPREDG